MLLIASPTAAAREDAASRVRLHETNGVGVWGLAYLFQFLWWHKRPFWGLHLRSLVAPVARVSARHTAGMLLSVLLRQTFPAVSASTYGCV